MRVRSWVKGRRQQLHLSSGVGGACNISSTSLSVSTSTSMPPSGTGSGATGAGAGAASGIWSEVSGADAASGIGSVTGSSLLPVGYTVSSHSSAHFGSSIIFQIR